jgi:WD40 repeat protein
VCTKPAGIWCYDVETGREIWQCPLNTPAYFPAFSADGNALVAGDKAGMVHVWDAATGKESSSFRAGMAGCSNSVRVTFDGKAIATNCDYVLDTTAVAIWDAATGKLLSDLPGHAAGIQAAGFTPDGSALHTIGREGTIRRWNVVSGNEENRASAEPTSYLAVSPDGKTLFTGATNDGTLSMLDAQTGRVKRSFAAFARTLAGLALTADGRQIVAAGRDTDDEKSYLVRFFDADTSAKLREFGGSDAKIEQLAVSADGNVVATSHLGRRVFLWDASGKKLSEQVGLSRRIASFTQGHSPFAIGSIGLSPDGRWLAYSDQEEGVALVDARTGRETGRAKLKVYYQEAAARYELHDVLAFSADGKMIAWSGVESTSDILLIEVYTGKVRRRLRGDSYPVQRLVFSPDGSKLLTAGPDGSALIWNVFGQMAIAANAALPQDPEGLWAALADEDSTKAYRTICPLVATPEQAVGMLKTHLKPTPPVDEQRYLELVKSLESDQFAERTKATEELAALGDAALPLIRQTLAGQPSLEARRRLEALLAKSEGPVSAPEPLRTLRAIEVLEHIGTAEAKQVLTKLADGAAAAMVTREAKAALERLDRLK